MEEENRLNISVSQLSSEADKATNLQEKIRDLEQQLQCERCKDEPLTPVVPRFAARSSARDLSRASTTDTVSGEEDSLFVAVFQAAFFLRIKDLLALGSASECWCQATMSDFIWDAMYQDLPAFAGPRAALASLEAPSGQPEASSRTRILSQWQPPSLRFSTWSSVETGVEWKVSQRLLRSTGPGASIRSPNFSVRGFSGYFLFYPQGAGAQSRCSVYAVLQGAPDHFEACLGTGRVSRGVCKATAGKSSFGWTDAGPPFSQKTQRDALVEVIFSVMSPRPAKIEWCRLESS